jgi:hypothetical protein
VQPACHGGDAVESSQREHDLPAQRHAATHETGVASLWHDGGAGVGTHLQHGGDLVGGRRPHHRGRRAAEPSGPVDLVAGAHVVVDEHVARTDDRAERGDDAVHYPAGETL